MSAGQIRVLMSDYIEDLMQFDSEDVEAAARNYRRNPQSTYFPKVGELIGLASAARAARLTDDQGWEIRLEIFYGIPDCQGREARASGWPEGWGRRPDEPGNCVSEGGWARFVWHNGLDGPWRHALPPTALEAVRSRLAAMRPPAALAQ